MGKKHIKASKLVDKATNVFHESKNKVIKDNELLMSEIQEDIFEIDTIIEKIDELKEKGLEIEKQKTEKFKAIEKNNEVIKSLESFIK